MVGEKMNDFNIELISLNELLAIVKKNLKLIIICPLVTLLIAFIFSFYLIQPKYSVYTKVFIGKEETQDKKENYNNDDVQMYLKLLKTYSEVVKTNKLVSRAMNDYNINLTSSEVLSNLSCNPTEDTQILVIKFENSDKDLAVKVVTAITDEFIKTSDDLIPNGTVKVVEDVVVPKSPSKPNRKLNLFIGFVLGAAISFGIIFLKEVHDNTFKTKEKLKRVIGVPVLGLIPDEAVVSIRLRRLQNSRRRSKRNNNKLIMESASTSFVSEAYRTLQTNIKYSSSKKVQTLLITSAQLQEGKSTVACNLALGFSEENIKVIILDCDFRNPSVHKKFSLENTAGLSELIQGKEKFENVVHKYHKNLDIITSGTSSDNPASMFSSNEMNTILNQLKEKYDLIILDSAPVLAVTDAQILSTKVDGTLIVVRYGISKVPWVLECKNLLDMVDGNLLGTVLHGTEINKNSNYSYEGYSMTHYNNLINNR